MPTFCACAVVVLSQLGCGTTPAPAAPEPTEEVPAHRTPAPQYVAESEDSIDVEDVLSRLARAGWITAHKRISDGEDPASTSFLVKTYATAEPSAVVDVKTFSDVDSARDLFVQLRESSYRTARRGRTLITVFCSGQTPSDLEDCDRVLPAALRGAAVR